MPDLPLVHLVRESQIADRGEASTLVLLHGLRSNEQDLIALAPELDPRLTVISVRAPVVMGPSAYAWYPVQFLPAGGFSVDMEAAGNNLDTLLDYFRLLPAALGLDPKRLYAGGFSQGAIMTLAAALSEPELFAGIICMSGRMPPTVGTREQAAPARLQGLPALIVHGSGDSVIPVHYGREVRDALSRLPVDLTWREYDMGHYVNAASLHDISEWLTSRLNKAEDWRDRK